MAIAPPARGLFIYHNLEPIIETNINALPYLEPAPLLTDTRSKARRHRHRPHPVTPTTTGCITAKTRRLGPEQVVAASARRLETLRVDTLCSE